MSAPAVDAPSRPPATAPHPERGRRGSLAFLVAVVVLAAAVLSAIAAIQIKLKHDSTVLGDVHTITRHLRTTSFDQTSVLITGIVVAAVGVLLLLAALAQPAKKAIDLTSDRPELIVTVTRTGLARYLSAAALRVDGVDTVKVYIRRRAVRVRATTRFRDRTGLPDALRDTVEARLAGLRPLHHRPVTVRVSGKKET